MREAVGRRCQLGCASWPDSLDFQKCLQCGKPTERMRGLIDILDESEARRLLQHAKFNAFYSKHCARLKIPVAGALPSWYEEQLGPLDPALLRASAPRLRPTKP